MENPGQNLGEVQPIAQPSGVDELVSAVLDVAEGRRVLVVHDEESSVQAVTRALEPHGFRAVGCTVVDNVVERARNLGSHAVILDLTMGDGRGFETLRMLKADPTTADIPVVVIGPESETQSARNMGASSLVAKRSGAESKQESPLEPVGMP
jgi:CheY-like chemotaxis protein